MKKNIIFLLLISMFGLSCTNSYYTTKQSLEVEQKGQVLVENFLKKINPNIQIPKVNMQVGAKAGQNIYSGYYASNVVEAYFSVDSISYQIFVNLDDQSCYTNYGAQILENAFEQILSNFLKEKGVDSKIEVSNLKIDYLIVNHGIAVNNNPKKLVDVEVFLDSVFPINAINNPLEFFNNSFDNGQFYKVDINYCLEKDIDIQLFEEFCKKYNIPDLSVLNINNNYNKSSM